MFRFKFEPDISLLTATRSGLWSLETVRAYEASLRIELAKLGVTARPTAFIIDIRSSGAQEKSVAEALRRMVAGLGHLNADRTVVVTSSGIAKLEATRVADANARVFTSMVLARDWALGTTNPRLVGPPVHDAPSNAEVEGSVVHVLGPDSVDVMLTPAAALETAKRIGAAAEEALLVAPTATTPNKPAT
ncbi:hypothetical protein [Sphingomonas sp. UYP23]